jgi:hypothetical protein
MKGVKLILQFAGGIKQRRLYTTQKLQVSKALRTTTEQLIAFCETFVLSCLSG